MSNFNTKYDDNKKDGKIYIYGKNIKENGDNYRKAEAFCDIGKTYIETQYNIEQQALEFEIKDKVMLYESDAGQTKYWCWLVEAEKGNTTTGLHICRRTSKGKVYDEQEVTLNPHAISILKKFLDEIKLYQEDVINKIQTTNNNFDKILTNDEFLKIVEKNNCKIIKPRGIILIGTKTDLNEKETKYLRILNSSYHNLYIITYQQLLEKSKNILSLSQKIILI